MRIWSRYEMDEHGDYIEWISIMSWLVVYYGLILIGLSETL